MTQLADRSARTHADLRRAFGAIDWAFSKSTALAPHDIHPYPARFIPELPTAALGLVRGVEGDVLDPFCGAGTTVIEALRDGRHATGIDLNPIATLISRVKSQRWDVQDDVTLNALAVELHAAALSGNSVVLREARETIPRLDHWFSPETQSVLAGATGLLATISEPVWRDRVALAISAAVVRLSRQDSDTRYAAVENSMGVSAAAAGLVRSLLKLGAQLRAFAPHHTGTTATIVTDDAGTAVGRVARASCAAAIFSPPYPNAYEYWLYHKYRMYWLGFDPMPVRAAEIGARPHYSGSGRSTIATFSLQMAPVMLGIAEALVPSGVCVVVVGDSQIKGELYDNGRLFLELAERSGFSFVARASRPIRANRKSFNLAVARIKAEHVLLFQKP